MPTRREPPEGDVEPGDGEGAVEDESVRRLVLGLIAESTTLVRQEIELARTELAEKVELLRRYVTGMAIGAALLAVAFFFLLSALDRGFAAALATWLDDEVALWLAPLILGALLAGIGFWLLMSARRTLRAEGLTPERTVETLRENTTWIKERLR